MAAQPTLCPVCHQPECPESTPAGELPFLEQRGQPTAFSSRLRPGQHEYRGYCDWAVHPDEAIFVLHRGYALVDGQRCSVRWIHNEAFVTQIEVRSSEYVHALEDAYLAAAAADKPTVEVTP